jgi:succinate dehydrogenase / fumarate reductase cytochrome b subunit
MNSPCCQIFSSSIGKKYLMALSGLVLAGFVFVHMLGNLQLFLGQEALNAYAYKLQSIPAVLWGFRLFLLLATLTHVLTAILLVRENRAARPKPNADEKFVQATVASRSMGLTGSLLFAFIVFHVLHYTVRVTHPEYQDMHYVLEKNGKEVHDVFTMIVVGFTGKWISATYIVCMAMLCLHLTHGVSSLFQTVGIRNTAWKARLDGIAIAYGWIIFIGFISVPMAVLMGVFKLPG